MQTINGKNFDEERVLYAINDATVTDCTFDGPADGESAFKEARDVTVRRCTFRLRYPFWHTTNGSISECSMTEGCRAALWYDRNITINDCTMRGVKALRESHDITLKNCDIVSPEFGWRCGNVNVCDTTLESEYPFFESSNITLEKFTLKGKYSFQYVTDSVIRDSVLNTKDAFWHSKNVTVYDSTINGEYLGWYSENLRLVRCRISGTQPLCYCKGLVLEDCTMENADLSFEYSDVNADIRGSVLSVKNPHSGRIVADSVGEIISGNSVMDNNCEIVIRKQ